MKHLTLISAFFTAMFCVLLVAPRDAQAFDTQAGYAVLMDYDTGTVLWGKNADEQMHPASMSKLMTLEMLFTALENGSVSMDDEFKISEHAWRAGGSASGSSTMFADLNSTVPVRRA